MALLKGEGTHQILYGTADIFSGLRHNRGYLARPDHSGSFPTVLLAHGHDGITSSVKAFARRLARYGLAVVGPDLYRGVRSEWPSLKRTVADLTDALFWMESEDTPWVKPGLVGMLAVDEAAPAALHFAADADVIGGVVLISPALHSQHPSLPVPILGFYGKDESVGNESRTAREALPQAEWVLYGGVSHGLIDESAEDYRWEVAEDVADRTVALFHQTLRP